MTKRNAVFLGAVLVIVLGGFSHAELYYYTDEKGMIRITDDISAVPENQRSAAKPAPPASEPAEDSEAAAQDDVKRNAADNRHIPAARAEPPADKTVPAAGSPAGSAGPSNLSREFKEEFKDVIAASSIPPEGRKASCAEFKEGMQKDMDRVFQAIRELGEAKKKGALGFTDKLKGVWMLKSLAWTIFRHETGPEHCVKEFDKENEKRWEHETKEIEALTADINAK